MKLPGEKVLLVYTWATMLLLAAIVVSLPVEILVGVVPDDSFYYLTVGRNLSATGISTFDGENLASGYHPGWMLVIATVAHWISGKAELLRMAIFLSFAFHTAAGFLLFRCLRRLVPGQMAAIAAAVWMFGYLPLLTSAFALETSLYCFTFLLSYLVYLGRIDSYLLQDFAKNKEPCAERGNHSNNIPALSLVLFGATLGLCLWARTEGVVLLCCAVLWLGLGTLYKGMYWRTLIQACRRVVLTAGTAFTVILPWIIYSLYNFGTIRQSSGLMKTLWGRDEFSQLTRLERSSIYLDRFLEWISYAAPGTWGGDLSLAITMSLVWLTAFAAATIYIMRRPVEIRRKIGQMLPALAYPVMHLFLAGVIYSVFFSDVQCWYLALPYLEFFIVIVVLFGAIHLAESKEKERKSWLSLAFLVACVFMVLSLIRFFQTFNDGYWPWQRDVYASIGPIENMMPKESRIGAFNAGIPGYFGQKRIINLDGLANETVVPYWQSRQLDRYLSIANIDFIIDEEFSLVRAKRFMQVSPHLKELARFKLTNFISPTRFLWKVQRDEDNSP